MERSARIKVSVAAAVAVALMLFAMVSMAWFVIRIGPVSQSIGLRQISDLPTSGVMFVTLCRVAMYAGVATLLATLWQTAACLTGNSTNAVVTKLGTGVGSLAALAAIGGGYLFGPDEVTGMVNGMSASLTHTMAPLVMVLGVGAAVFALHFAAKDLESAVELPPARAYAARVPEPAMPPSERVKQASTPIPPLVKRKLQFTVLSGEITRAGIDARREDGSTVLVMWRDVIGVVARRLPPSLVGSTFVDVVSSAGQTLRLLPWSRLTGEDVPVGDDVRARAILAMVVRYCPGAKLDPATKTFIDGTTPAAQLPDEATMSQHDARLA